MSKEKNTLKKQLKREQKKRDKKAKTYKTLKICLLIAICATLVAAIAWLSVYLYHNNFSLPQNQFKTQELSDGTLAITGLNDRYRSSSVTVPEQIQGKKVTQISKNAFYNVTEMTEITIACSVTYIGDLAFQGCSSLRSVVFQGSSVTVIGNMAFNDCVSLESIAIPEGVEEIGDQAFGDCRSLKSFVAPSTLKSIGKYTFYGCTELNSNGAIVLSSSITQIGEFAFHGISKSSITAPEGSYAAEYADGLSD